LLSGVSVLDEDSVLQPQTYLHMLAGAKPGFAAQRLVPTANTNNIGVLHSGVARSDLARTAPDIGVRLSHMPSRVGIGSRLRVENAAALMPTPVRDNNPAGRPSRGQEAPPKVSGLFTPTLIAAGLLAHQVQSSEFDTRPSEQPETALGAQSKPMS